MSRLPIDVLIPDVLSNLEKSPSLVLQASPGSGKTTRVPPALLELSFLKSGEVWVLEPRRLAAKYSARRVAEERGVVLGEEVGYHFRLEKVLGPKTRLLYLTEGMLIRRLMHDPTLKNVKAIVLDEFHERHLHTDVALAYLLHLQRNARPDLRLIVMSATLDAEKISKHLSHCPILSLDLPIHPVELRYREGRERQYLEEKVFEAVRAAITDTKYTGNILVFLPGMADIRRAESRLLDFARKENVDLFTLHGDLSKQEQDKALGKSTRRKILLSTNVAETSLTIEGVTTVIDSGLHRQASFSAWSNIGSLHTKAISKASAIQRAGRSGRQSPGCCIRLYAESDFLNRVAFDTPEIQRSDLSQTLLELAQLGVGSPDELPWLEAPKKENLDAAIEMLLLLKAVEGTREKCKVTERGRRIAEFPAHPRIAAMCLASETWGSQQAVVRLAAMLVDGKLLDLDVLHSIPNASDSFSARTEQQLFSCLENKNQTRDPHAVARSVLEGFPDRVARRRSTPRKDWELLFATGGSADMPDSDLVRSNEYFVVLDVQETKTERQLRAQKRVRALVPILPEWLFDLESPLMTEVEEVHLVSGKVRGVSILRYGAIELTRTEGDPKNAEALAQVLLKDAFGIDLLRPPSSLHDWSAALAKLAGEEFPSTLARVELIRKHRGDASLDGKAIEEWLVQASQNATSVKELRAVDWTSTFAQHFLAGQAHLLDRLAPTHFELKSGRRAKVTYELGKTPFLESRLQDFFGMKVGPAILDGKLFLTLHLLAPNYRAVQVTTDLAGFWVRAYPEVRKELSRRYPRHKWPEDPR